MPSVAAKIDHETRFEQASDPCIAVFSALFNLYGKLWAREHSESPSQEFDAFTRNYDAQTVKRVVNRARQEKAQGNTFPPTLGEIEAWAIMPTEMEFVEIGARIMAGCYESEIEHYLVCKCKWNLARTEENKFYNKLKKFYWEAVALNQAGKLFSQEKEILSLPPCSAVSHIEIAKQKTKISTANNFRVKARIDRLKRAQKNQPPADH